MLKAEWINECTADFQARTTTKRKHIKIECQARLHMQFRNHIVIGKADGYFGNITEFYFI